jgi:hypothetical protein
VKFNCQAGRVHLTGIRKSVRVLLEVRMDALARKFHETHSLQVKDELERLLKEYGKLKEPWVFRPWRYDSPFVKLNLWQK